MLISWATLLDRTVSRAITAGESHTECDIQQLRGLAQQVDEEAFLPLRSEELGPEFPRRLKSLWSLVKDVIECLERRDLAEKKPKKGDNTRGEYGWYLTLSRTGAEAWFGLDCYKWATQNTPLWLYLYSCEKPLSKIPDNLGQPSLQDPPEFIEENNALVIPIYLPVGVEYDAVRDAVVERIKEIERLINPAD